MVRLPLRLGPLDATGYVIQRSGLRWLRADGHACHSGEIIAYCNVGLRGTGQRGARPFAEEERDFQVAIATRVAGRLVRAHDPSPGGWLDQMQYYETWTPDTAIGSIESDTPHAPGETTQLLMLAGRRFTEIAEVRSGLLAGWHDRRRAWWGESETAGEDPIGSLLCLGICDQVGIVQGEQRAFLEMFEGARGPAHVAYYADDSVVHCAAVASEQLARTPESAREIAADFSRTFAANKLAPQPKDWLFVSALMGTLLRAPLAEQHHVLLRTGLRKIAAPNAILTSLHAEGPFIYRHRRLGYTMQCHGYRVVQAGPAVHAWLHAEFERVRHTPDAIYADYCKLIDDVRARAAAEFFVLNMVSTATSENIQSYAEFDRPLGNTLGSVRARELNAMLHDLARERNVAIVDVDAIAADLGTLRHSPDGIHGSALLQDETRAELLRLLRDRGVPGFAPAVR